MTEKVNKDETREAYVLAKMETTHFGLLLGDLDSTKADLEECSKHLDRFDSVDPQINASFLRVSADYYKVTTIPWNGRKFRRAVLMERANIIRGNPCS